MGAAHCAAGAAECDGGLELGKRGRLLAHGGGLEQLGTLGS